jgi:prefoldin subunit 5
MSYSEENQRRCLHMKRVTLDGKIKESMKEVFRRLDEDLEELEELQSEMDKMLYDIERRITKLRTRGA